MLTSLLDSWPKGTAFEGEHYSLHIYQFKPICNLHSNSSPAHFRLVRPHKVSAIQQRYSINYGDRVEIRPVEDLIKGDFTDVLKGVYQHGRNTASSFCYRNIGAGV